MKTKLPIFLPLILFLASCTGLPDNIQPVNKFQLEKYLGTWYEISRLDHSFERGLTQVTAEYSMRDDGGVNVINRGFSEKEQKWSTAQGKAYFVKDDQTGHLKVSFFGPFYSSYVIFYLDDDYQHAAVSGFNTKYLWLLSRKPTVPDNVKYQFEKLAKEKGFEIENLIYL
ncbi:lipocalin family protein [Catenovulum maritimum]|uniref:Outer membrane lipoprotein Blc n=1 Tax=Catenovulum maritimum TaxID=1513271 RepID=A0A0J8GX40_9ALTE|nr:lipocalin family protein [Catenovulum maritimum]KMT65829.1 lipocalin [Catenovulum maritimum]